MLNREDLLFGNIMLRRGALTEAQLAECLRVQMEMQRLGREVRLGKLMIEKGFITAEKIRTIVEEQRTLRNRFLTGSDLQSGDVIEGCQIQEKLGEGGSGTVYKAFSPKLNRMVAIKAVATGAEDEKEKEAFRRLQKEGERMATLDHPAVVKVYALGEMDGRLFLVMEFIDGEGLDRKIRREGALDVAACLGLTLTVAQALEYAHGKNLIHRDIKPANLLMPREGGIKVTDFGLAREIRGDMTRTTTAMAGTPHFMSPEQCRGEELDERTDVYSLGITLYCMLTGDLPFTGDSALQVLMQHVKSRVPDPREKRPDLHRDVSALVQRMTESDREKRYRSAAEVVSAIEGALRRVSGKSWLHDPAFRDYIKTSRPTQRRSKGIQADIADKYGLKPPPPGPPPPPKS